MVRSVTQLNQHCCGLREKGAFTAKWLADPGQHENEAHIPVAACAWVAGRRALEQSPKPIGLKKEEGGEEGEAK